MGKSKGLNTINRKFSQIIADLDLLSTETQRAKGMAQDVKSGPKAASSRAHYPNCFG